MGLIDKLEIEAKSPLADYESVNKILDRESTSMDTRMDMARSAVSAVNKRISELNRAELRKAYMGEQLQARKGKIDNMLRANKLDDYISLPGDAEDDTLDRYKLATSVID